MVSPYIMLNEIFNSEDCVLEVQYKDLAVGIRKGRSTKYVTQKLKIFKPHRIRLILLLNLQHFYMNCHAARIALLMAYTN